MSSSETTSNVQLQSTTEPTLQHNKSQPHKINNNNSDDDNDDVKSPVKKQRTNCPSNKKDTKNSKRSSSSSEGSDSSDSSSNSDSSSSDDDDDDDEEVHLTKQVKSAADVVVDLDALEQWVGHIIMPKGGNKPKAAVIRFLAAPNSCVEEYKTMPWSEDKQTNMIKMIDNFNCSRDEEKNNQDESKECIPRLLTNPKNSKSPILQEKCDQMYVPVCMVPDDEEMPQYTVKFNQLQGIISFKNATALFVNNDKTTYSNLFAYDRKSTHQDNSSNSNSNIRLGNFGLSYYASPSQTYKSAPIVKLLETIPSSSNDDNNNQKRSKNNGQNKILVFVRDDSNAAKKAPSTRTKSSIDSVHVGDKYVYWGAVDIVHHGLIKDVGVTMKKNNNNKNETKDDGKEIIQFLLHIKSFRQLLLKSWYFYDQVSNLKLAQWTGKSNTQ